jgi:hypothetical protein
VGAHDAVHRKTQGAGDTPNLALAALMHRHLKLGETRLTAQNLDFDGRRSAIVDDHAAPPDVEHVLAHEAMHGHFINLGVVIARVG